MGDDDIKANMRRFENPYDSWTRLAVFRSVGANNAGRSAEGQARKVNENYDFNSNADESNAKQ